MPYRKENFTFQEEERFLLFTTAEKQEELHCHNCLELNYIVSGCGTYMIDGKLYPIEKGDIFVINNSEHHLAIHKEPVCMTVLVFAMDFLWKSPLGAECLKPFFNRNQNFSHRITAKEFRYEDICYAFRCVSKEFSIHDSGESMVAESAAQLLLAQVYRYYNEKQEIEEKDSYNYMSGSIQQAFSYINEHFAEKISLEDVAEASSLSRTYLSRYFKKMTGQTLFNYIQQTRIKYASYLLQTGQTSITQIALDCGFDSVSYFNRIFKKYYGITPGQYRKKNVTGTTVGSEP